MPRQPRTHDTRKHDQADRGPISDPLAHLNQKGQFQQGNDDEEKGEAPKNAHGAIIPRSPGDRSYHAAPSSRARCPPLAFMAARRGHTLNRTDAYGRDLL